MSVVGELLAFLKTNAFASGGLILLLVGGLAASLRSVPGRIWRVIRQRLILQVQVTSDDPAYAWLEEWVAKQSAARKTRSLRVVTRHIDDPEQPGKTQPRALLVPGPGEHALRYAGSYIWLTIDRERLQMASNSTGFFVNTMTLRILRGNREKLAQLVEEARVQYENRLAGFTQIHANSPYGEWELAAAKQVRRPESLILQGDLFARLRTDLQRFLDRKQWYVDMGIPHRRGYLLYGEPGNGKSSLVVMLAAALGKDVAVLSLSSSELTDERLQPFRDAAAQLHPLPRKTSMPSSGDATSRPITSSRSIHA